ncbi:MAG: FTR1 family protein [Sulfurimonas sp.]|nr:FTR1 family protein [Sulfurimonas sp.]
MLASFLITFREGLEAFLIVGIILSYLSKLQATKYNKYIYFGVMLGIIVSLAIAYIFQVVLLGIDDTNIKHYLMIGILLFATAVLSYMVVWMAKQSKDIKGEIEENLNTLVSAGNVFGMVFLAFLAVLREGFETVLFFSSLNLSQNVTMQDGAIGGGLGLVISLLLVYSIMKGAKNIPLKEFFKWTGLLILIIAGGLFGSAVSMMQASELIPIYVPIVYDISSVLDDRALFGTFLRALFGYNSSPTLLHLLSWAIYMLGAVYFWRKTYSAK